MIIEVDFYFELIRRLVLLVKLRRILIFGYFVVSLIGVKIDIFNSVY